MNTIVNSSEKARRIGCGDDCIAPVIGESSNIDGRRKRMRRAPHQLVKVGIIHNLWMAIMYDCTMALNENY